MAKELQKRLAVPRALVWKLPFAAGKFAELSVLQYAVSINLVNPRSIGAPLSLCEGAALAGDLIKLKWLHTERAGMNPTNVSTCAASSGNLDIMEWLADMGYFFPYQGKPHIRFREVMTAACLYGHLQIVQYLLSKGCEYNRY
jgi:Ankyrin repeats (3 copies)